MVRLSSFFCISSPCLDKTQGRSYGLGSPLTFSRWWSSSDQVFKITWYPIRYLPRRYSSSGMSKISFFPSPQSPSTSWGQVTMAMIHRILIARGYILMNQMPWLETPIIYDVRAKPRNIASLTGTKDLQMVRLHCNSWRIERNTTSREQYWSTGQHHLSSPFEA